MPTLPSRTVNDVVVHPNQGEVISCDQAGRIKQWDLSENICTHELVRPLPRLELGQEGGEKNGGVVITTTG